MTSPQAAAGANFERLVVDLFRFWFGNHVDRGRSGASEDRGDVYGIPGWTFELKAYRELASGINAGLRDLEREQKVTETPHGAVIVKRRGKGRAEDALFIMRLEEALPIIAQTGVPVTARAIKELGL